MTLTSEAAKLAAVEQWTADPCGEVATGASVEAADYFERLRSMRETYAPWMADVLDAESTRGLDVLDVGCGQGIDVAGYARAGARSSGVDLTPRHVEIATAHLAALGLEGDIRQGDAEALPFETASFDRVSSNGVLHHTPDFGAAAREVLRVLRPGGEARLIVYHRASLHYWLHQVLYFGLLRGKLMRERDMEGVMSTSVEYSSVGARPLVRAYTAGEARALLQGAGFDDVRTEVHHLDFADTLPTAAIGAVLPARSRARARRLLLDPIGRRLGWYVVVSGVRPA